MKILRWMFLFIFVLVVEVILSYVLIEIATSKARSRDDIGACIAEKKAEFGIVKSLSVYNFKSEEGFESNYEATFALKGGGVCTSLVTRYDFEKLKEGQKVKAGEASPYYFKIHGVRTQKELIEKYIFLAMFQAIVLGCLVLIFVVEHFIKIVDKFENLTSWAVGDPNGIEPKTNISFISLGVICTTCFIFSSLATIGVAELLKTTILFTAFIIVFGLICLIIISGFANIKYNLRVLGFGSTIVVLISSLFYLLFGLDIGYMFKQLIEHI
ncbi:hypothetical protein NQS96_08710 [Pseudoalteromonas shioyasakiensis]|uniref:hypothetical protein n=1 Tax=Pseudoalteromonas shioyasakiensis TaxID=1190813 RepID=UPI0021176319|nr:hypothetical protein [Pseudoalteromonas shioyasakiensis]MCQ8881869.1 hypothetical protein [Pseudoalteromonas shioyasakiensis]